MEWFIPDPLVPIRQGDVLIRRDTVTKRVSDICMVITADCDISKRKFGAQLACLRIESLDNYIRTIWGERKLDSIVADESDRIRERLAKWHKKSMGESSTLTVQATLTWLRRDSPETICDLLSIPFDDRKDVLTSINAFLCAIAAKESNSTIAPINQFVAFVSALRSKDLESCWRETLQQARNEKLPEDVFILPTLPQVDIEGAIVMLREVIGVELENTFTRATDTPAGGYLRVGRMEPTFKYAISQAFGTLYSRIGLPSEYETRRKHTVERIGKFEMEQANA